MKQIAQVILSAQVPKELALRARIVASQQDKSRSQLVREALEFYLTHLNQSKRK